jgi:hypothetical protein
MKDILLIYFIICTIAENYIMVKDHCEEKKEERTLLMHVALLFPAACLGIVMIPMMIMDKIKLPNFKQH